MQGRWLQFSLRGFFVALTALGVWLGVAVQQAREQRKAVNAIEALGGAVVYDWEFHSSGRNGNRMWCSVCSGAGPNGPAWLRRIIGDEFFQEVEAVQFLNHYDLATNSLNYPGDSDLQKAIPHLTRLRGLKAVVYESENASDKLKNAIPDCEVVHRRISRHGFVY